MIETITKYGWCDGGNGWCDGGNGRYDGLNGWCDGWDGRYDGWNGAAKSMNVGIPNTLNVGVHKRRIYASRKPIWHGKKNAMQPLAMSWIGLK